jgi:hypothetical protein
VLRRYAQIDPRSAFFTVLGSPLTTWTVDASGSSSSLMSVTQFTSNLSSDVSGLVIVGDLLKDLGRQITVYDDTIAGYPHVAIFRQVLYIDNTLTSETEGIGDSVIFYICVWAQHDSSSSPQFTASRVARTG